MQGITAPMNFKIILSEIVNFYVKPIIKNMIPQVKTLKRLPETLYIS